ncbi:hypothetical protein GWK47_034830 [Chionoecetes opilio]|uniref:Uncharacterized protein n=1 Tax=Chionoecetes opilio TaxID=41210 RepID=A0A8J5CNX6_CHIOP|nr:hypothetical protein GWK47_034830 [Chionoecetes opilio]
MWRFSKVVVVGDARMSLLTNGDIMQQLGNVNQVFVVPNLTLSGVLEVVQKVVVKEECPRGILLLCLAGLHGTLVESRVPEECKAAGHSDMQEMVPATKDSLNPEFTKQLASLKKKLLEALGRGSNVLFYPVLPVDIANYNAIAAKKHFDATGHKLEHLPQADIINHLLIQQHKFAVMPVNGPKFSQLKIVNNEFYTRQVCRKFTDELLQDGYSPTLDMVERFVLPQLRRTVSKANTLRFHQAVLVGDARLGQVVRMQQQKGVEPCTFILQEEPGLRTLTPDSPAVKQLSGMCNALIFLTVTIKDFIDPTADPQGDETQCILSHDPSKAFDNFLREAERVDQLLRSATHRCTIITTLLMPFDIRTLARDEAKSLVPCDKCKITEKSVTHAVKELGKILFQKNHLPSWDYNYAFQRDGIANYSHQGSRRNTKVEQKLATTWEYFLTCCQGNIGAPARVSITTVLQDSGVMSGILPKAKLTSRTQRHSSKDKEQTRGNHSRHSEQRGSKNNGDRKQRQRSHSRDKEKTENRSSRNKEKSHSRSNRDKEHNHSRSRDKKQTVDSHSRDEKQRSSSNPIALDDITSSPELSNSDLDTISTGNLNFTPSPCPSSINSPDNFADLSNEDSMNHGEWHTDAVSPSLSPSPKPWRQITVGTPPPPLMDLWLDSRDGPPTPERPQDAELDQSVSSLFRKGSYSPPRDKERVVSAYRYISPDPLVTSDRSRSRGRSRSRERSRERNRSRSEVRSRSRSYGPKNRVYGRRSRSGSPTWLPLNPERKAVFRQSLSRSPSPPHPYKSISGGRSFSKGRRSTSRSRRSISSDKRSISRGRRSVSRGWRSGARNRRSLSRDKRLNSWGRSISRERSISRGRRSLSRSRRSLSRENMYASIRRSLSRGRRSMSRSRRSISRFRRSISQDRRSMSRGKRDRRSISQSRRSISPGRRSVSRDRRGRSSSLEQHTSTRLPAHMPSYHHDKSREDTVKEALKTLRSVHEKECEMYRLNPTVHPDIGPEYRRFWDRKTESILALGGDPAQYNVGREWQLFWMKRLEEIFLESWRIKRNQCLDLLDARHKPSIPELSVRVHHSHSPSLSPSLNISSESQQRSFNKRKMRESSSSLQGAKRKKNQDTRSPDISFLRDRQGERSSVISDAERFPDYSRALQSEKEANKGLGLNSLGEHCRNPQEMPWVTQQGSQENRTWHEQNPPHQSLLHDESWQHTSQHIIRDALSIDKHDSMAEDGRAQHLGQQRAGPLGGETHGIVKDTWYQMSSQKCVGVNSSNPELPGNETRGQQDSWEHLDSQIKEKNALSGHHNFKKQLSLQETLSSFASRQESQAYRGILKLDTVQPASKGTNNASSIQARRVDSHYNTGSNTQKAHTAHTGDQKTTSITQIFKSFAANLGNKPSRGESTKQVHKDEVPSITASNENIKIDVVNVLEVLTHLGDKLGALCDPLKLVLERAKELQKDGADPMSITNDQDNKLLLQMIQEKLQGILKDGTLNIIKKVIVQEAEQRLSMLLEIQKQRNLTGNLSLTQLARHCLDMNLKATVDFIRKVLQCQGRTHLPDEHLMKLYMDVKAEQLKMIGDHHNDRADAPFTDNTPHQSHNSEAPLVVQAPKDSVGPRGSSSALSLGKVESHTSTSQYNSSPWRQPHGDATQSMHNFETPSLHWNTSYYPNEAVTGSDHSSNRPVMNPSQAFPASQSSTSRSWSPQCNTTLPHFETSTSNLSGPPQGTIREARYNPKVPKYVSKKPIRITLPKHQPQKNMVGAFNPLGECNTDSEDYE